MALPQRKANDEAPEHLGRLSNADLLQLAHLEAGSPAGRAAYEILLSRIAVNDLEAELVKSRSEVRKEQFHAVRHLGLEAITREAEEMRADWKAHLINFLASDPRHQSRALLVREIRAFCLQRRYQGKNGGAIKESTIRRWLSTEVEQEIRDLAMNRPRQLSRAPR